MYTCSLQGLYGVTTCTVRARAIEEVELILKRCVVWLWACGALWVAGSLHTSGEGEGVCACLEWDFMCAHCVNVRCVCSTGCYIIIHVGVV